MTSRVYTPLDQRLEEALIRAARSGLVPSGASRSQQLRALALYADEHLRDDQEREEKLAAYRELAADADRAVAIRASVRAAAADGIL